ncbi:hypothetical protein LDENG_00183650 [Lucifuga dentata]|nr:hypothetical protein LDENG_00183650 [Lucifuga dentata]
MALHFILQHLDSPGTYARILFVDCSSAFNTVIPALLQDKLSQLNVSDSTRRWITDFLSDRRKHKHVSDSRTISTGSPQGCVLCPLLFSLYTNSCTSSHQSIKLLKFVDDTTLIGLISGEDESTYRWEIDHLVTWCRQNNLELNALETVKNPAPPTSIILCDTPVDIVEHFLFLGTIITQDLKWELTKKAQQRMYFLWQLKKFNILQHLLHRHHESILTSSITVWYAAATAKDKGRLQSIICSADRVIGCNLPSLHDLYTSRTQRRANKIVADPSHPGHKPFEPLPSVVHQDQNSSPQKLLLPNCSKTH